jgi:WD40 repeat protein
MAAGRNTSAKTDAVPRVFLSYARADGELFAAELRQRLQAEHIPLWQDRVDMEGGKDWWQQITEALDVVEFMVLVMTPAGMQSETVRKEWHYARRMGVCVYPVQAAPNLDFSSVPRWMSSLHFYDLTNEWQKFLNDLNTRCQEQHVPFMCKDLPPDFVPRPHEFDALISKLLDEQREEPVAITAALRGAGGYGKTTMAMALCHDLRIQDAFDDGILWVTLGENPVNLVGKVEDLIYMLSHERSGFMGIDAAGAQLAELLADRDILLVVDDVWNAIHLKPFLQGGKRCARLITTRNEDVLPTHVQSLVVDAMQSDEAMQLLGAGVEGVQRLVDERAFRLLSARLGEWPLLLKLVNGVLRERVSKNQPVLDALSYINDALDECGLTIFDARDAQDRSQAVAKTLSVSFQLLNEDEYSRYTELAIFPEDIDIPLPTLEKLWSMTGGMGKIKTEKLCEDFSRLSLVLNFDPQMRTIRLHGVIRSYLQTTVGDAQPALHAHLLDAYALTRWADLPEDEPYQWDHLAEHFVAARRLEELIATVKDLRYLAKKTLVRKAYAAEADLAIAEQQVSTDVLLRLLTRHFANMGHLLNRCRTFDDLAPVLYSRLVHLHELADLCQAFEPEIPRPYLTSWYQLPDLPDPALIRTLGGHTDWVTGCAISPSGDLIVSASRDQTLKIWDTRTGEEQRTLRGHTEWVNGCAISPAGDLIVSASSDKTLKVWDVHTGEERLTLRGHTAEVWRCAISPAGDFIVSASADQTLKVWGSQTGEEQFTLHGHTAEVNGCAISPAGDLIVSASADRTLKVWDVRTVEERRTLEGHTGLVRCCAISPEGDSIVSASGDHTLKVWDAHTGEERLTIRGHTDWVTGCAISPEGDFIVSASGDQTLKVWDARTGEEQRTLRGHTNQVRGCTISPLGDFIVSASSDHTLKVWDTHTGEEWLTLRGHRDEVLGCAINSTGDSIASASLDRMLKVWEVHSGVCLCTLVVNDDLNFCAFHPDGEHIVAAGTGGLYFLRWVR